MKLKTQQIINYSLISLVSIIVLFLLIFPIGYMVAYSSKEGLINFVNSLKDPVAVFAIKLSIVVATITTIINSLFGTVVSYILTKYDFFGKNAINAIIDFPVAIPTAVTGFTLLLLYGPIGFLGKILAKHGITVMFAFSGILLAHIIITFPFIVHSVSSVLKDVEKIYEEAAKTLGASGFQIFTKITLPLIKDGIVSGSVLTFARSLGEFGATIMVSGNIAFKTQTAPLYIFSRFNAGDLVGASAVAILLASISFLLLYSLKIITKEK